VSEYDELMRDLLVERFRPTPSPRAAVPDRLGELARALQPPEERRASSSSRRRSRSRPTPPRPDGEAA
jgi:hypothetical protein